MMCSVQGSEHYKMIVVNYLELVIYRMAGVDSQDEMPAFLSATLGEERVRLLCLSLWRVNLGVAPVWGSLEEAGPASRTAHFAELWL